MTRTNNNEGVECVIRIIVCVIIFTIAFFGEVR